MSKYGLPGILNVSTGENNGNDLIGFVYDYEIKNGNWDANLIPFLDVGNGIIFVLVPKKVRNHLYITTIVIILMWKNIIKTLKNG